MRKTRLVLATVGLFFSFASFSQSVTPATLNATGGTNFFTFYRFEWSFGEAIAIETMSSPNLVVTNGVLQPGTHNPATINNNEEWGKDEIKILPNPTRDLLEIDFFSKQKGKVTMNLFDATGRLMARKEFDYYGTGRIEKWDFTRFVSGTYFLNIMLAPTGTSVAKKGAFKVIKVK
jgi:hypothetical protein